VDVTCELNLAGALAQFGKAAVIREIANRMTAEFVKNFEARLAATAPPAQEAVSAPAAPQRAPEPLDAGKLGWAIVKDWVTAFFRALFGRRA
jgi:hypothetical protein